MPPLTRWFVKTSFIYLALALIAGLLLELQSGLKLASIGGLFPVYIHLFVLGWLTQLIWISFALIDLGILFSCLHLWFAPVRLIGRAAEVVAGMLFAIGLWRRVKPHGIGD